MNPNVYRVLVVCTGNICRSPIGEAMLKRELADEINGKKLAVTSAGTNALVGYGVPRESLQAAPALNVDVSNHRAQALTERLVSASKLVLGMEPWHLHEAGAIADLEVDDERLRLWRSFENPPGGSVRDPYGMPVESYLTCGNTLSKALPAILDHIRSELYR